MARNGTETSAKVPWLSFPRWHLRLTSQVRCWMPPDRDRRTWQLAMRRRKISGQKVSGVPFQDERPSPHRRAAPLPARTRAIFADVRRVGARAAKELLRPWATFPEPSVVFLNTKVTPLGRSRLILTDQILMRKFRKKDYLSR
ncbi:hypothetical protein GN956_G13803 [Arapaima gigas]